MFNLPPDNSTGIGFIRLATSNPTFQSMFREKYSLEEFNEIAQEVQNDPALHARVMAMIQQKDM